MIARLLGSIPTLPLARGGLVTPGEEFLAENGHFGLPSPPTCKENRPFLYTSAERVKIFANSFPYGVARDLGALEKAGLVRKIKLGRTNFYVNDSLFLLLSR